MLGLLLGVKPLALCWSCGHWAEDKPKALLKPCRRGADRGGEEALRWVRRGLHPRNHEQGLLHDERARALL